MSRGRKARASNRDRQRLFQLGPYWLGSESNTDYLFYYWYEPSTRRTRRKTTGLRDLEEAKTWLAKLVLSEPADDPRHSDKVTIAAVRRFYFSHHINAPNAMVRDSRSPKRAFDLLAAYLDAVLLSERMEGAPKVGNFTLARQEGFMRWCRDNHGLSGKTISTYLSYIKAAFRFCAKLHLITDARGREREATLLSSVPYVDDSEDRVSKITNLPRSQPRNWIPTDHELAALIDGLPADMEHEAAFRYVIVALNTWARPEAICQLSIRAQVDFDRAIVHLNAAGRLQNKKIRPTIRLTENLRGWLLHWDRDYPIAYFGRPVRKIDGRTLKKAAVRAGLDPVLVNRYTLRHYMATRVRRVEGISVSREERASWMGHVDPHFRTTEAWYESLDPDYLLSPARATDAIMMRLNEMTKRTLVSPNVRPTAQPQTLKSHTK